MKREETERKRIEAERRKAEYESRAFGVDRKRNPVVIINGVEGIVCKGFCGKWKPLDEYYKAKNHHGRMNFCIECIKEIGRQSRKRAKEKKINKANK